MLSRTERLREEKPDVWKYEIFWCTERQRIFWNIWVWTVEGHAMEPCGNEEQRKGHYDFHVLWETMLINRWSTVAHETNMTISFILFT